MKELLKTVEAEQGRAPKGEPYWIVDSDGTIEKYKEDEHSVDDLYFELGNYYPTPEDANRAEKQIRLFRILDRFSRQNGWTDELWEDGSSEKFYIYSSQCGRTTETGYTRYHRDMCQVYFISESVARQAIEKYHDLIMEVMAI